MWQFMIIYSVLSSHIHIESIKIIKSGLSIYRRDLNRVLAILPIAWFNSAARKYFCDFSDAVWKSGIQWKSYGNQEIELRCWSFLSPDTRSESFPGFGQNFSDPLSDWLKFSYPLNSSNYFSHPLDSFSHPLYPVPKFSGPLSPVG